MSAPAEGKGAAMGVLAVLMPTAAAAHEGQHETLETVAALRHLFEQPDHLLAFSALLLIAVPVAGVLLRRARR